MRKIGMLKGEPEFQNVDVMKGDFVFYGMLVANKGGLIYIKKSQERKL